MPIRILPDKVSSQIAAGEVIERPSSVVKELMENAIDAGAQSIAIRLQGSGQPLIEVSDDGCGIPRPEMELAVARFATSKLQTAEDLFRIKTLGFRGEALASIGSVAHLSIDSRVADAETGARISVEGGHTLPVVEIAHPAGTTIRVENLFFNVPARLKFLKRDYTERQSTLALLTRYALAYPSVRIKVVQDGKPVLQTSGSGDRREIIGSLFDPEIARQMIALENSDYGIGLQGFISPIHLTRSNRREITFFVNGRWVQDAALSAALIQAYHTYLMVGRYPLAVLFLQLPADEIDINVHPAKAEVRFREPDRIFSVIQRSIRRALLENSSVPPVAAGTQSWQAFPVQHQVDPAWEMAAEASPVIQPQLGMHGQDQAGPSGTGENPSLDLPLLRVIGQVGAAYIVAEGPDGLYLVDQHAAHERVLYEQFIRQADSRITSQQLLQPVPVHLAATQAALLENQLGTLNQLGFSVDDFGGGSFLVRALPAVFDRLSPETALRTLVEDFEEDETPLQQELEARIIARVCKRAAVKAGQSLSMEEMRNLISSLEACFSPRTCPHGRPTMIHLSVDLLERQFGRRGAR